MSVLAWSAVVVPAYCATAALVVGATSARLCDCGAAKTRSRHDYTCESIVIGVFWPFVLVAYVLWRFVLKPWWERVLVPLSQWAEGALKPKEAPDDRR